MDLGYGEEYEQYRAEVSAFLAEVWPPQGDDAELPREEGARRFRIKAVERGYLSRGIPRKYGGSEQPSDEIRANIIHEEFSRAHAPMDVKGMKEKFVEETVRGELHWCQGYSEPGSGSDLASLKTKGELVGDEWVLNGQKIWTTNAHTADWMFCLCRTEPEASKHAGISYLLVPMDQPGIEVRPLPQMTGGADFNEVFLTDARTKADHIVGKRGEGWNVSRSTLKHERNSIGSAAQSALMFQGLVHLAKTTEHDGRPNIEDPVIRQRIARLEGTLKAHEYSGLRQLTANAKGENPGIIQSMSKLIATNIGSEVAKIALDLLGDDGMLDPLESGGMMARTGGHGSWINQYMFSLGIAVAGGTANIQRNVIAERGLGLPRDIYAERSSGK